MAADLQRATQVARMRKEAEKDLPTLTKAELAELLFERLGLNKRESKDMVEAFFELVHGNLVNGEDVKLSGFGNFNIRRKAPRPGRNPRTGEAIPIAALFDWLRGRAWDATCLLEDGHTFPLGSDGRPLPVLVDRHVLQVGGSIGIAANVDALVFGLIKASQHSALGRPQKCQLFL